MPTHLRMFRRFCGSMSLIALMIIDPYPFIARGIMDEQLASPLNAQAQTSGVEEKDETGFTAFMHAIDDEKVDVAKSLLAKGADPNATDQFGWTAMFYAAVRGNSAAVAFLLAIGADVNIKDHRGMNALMWAAMQDDVEIVKALIKARTDINATAKSGATALTFAQKKKQGAAAKAIREAGGTAVQIDSSLIPKNIKSPADTSPQVLRRVKAEFSSEARSRVDEGRIVLRVLIANDGAVKSIRINYGLPYGMTEAAVKAVSKFIFSPAKYEGKPVAQWVRIEFDYFKL